MNRADIGDDQLRLLQIYREVFCTEAGRIVLSDIIAKAGLYASTGPADAESMNYAAGRRDLALEILRHAELKIQEPETESQALNSEPFLFPSSPISGD